MRMKEACGGEAKPGRQLSSLDMTLSRPKGYQQRKDSWRRETDEEGEDKSDKERLKYKRDKEDWRGTKEEEYREVSG